MCVLWWGRGSQLGDSFLKSSQHSFEEFAIRKEVTPWACCHYCRWWSSSASLHPHKIAMPFPSILLNPHCTLLVLVPFWAVLKYVATRGWVQLANRRYTHECLRRLLTRAIAHRLSAAKARHDFSRTIPHSVIMAAGKHKGVVNRDCTYVRAPIGDKYLMRLCSSFFLSLFLPLKEPLYPMRNPDALHCESLRMKRKRGHI